MLISIVNCTKKADQEVLNVIRAINRQLREDFTPYWHWTAQLRLEGRGTAKEKISSMKEMPSDLRGDAIIYLWDRVADVKDALGYHDLNTRGLPYGFVFTDLSDELKEPWSATLSHEALELVGDASVNTLSAGPHPQHKNELVYHWYEMCDAVQSETYEIDGVVVSNFVLPAYFTLEEQLGARNDFLNRVHDGKTLQSFGVNPGGYVGFFNPKSGEHETFSREGDETAAKRLALKEKMGPARRSPVYRQVKERIAKTRG